MLDWFDDIEDEDRLNQRPGTLQDVIEGFVHLGTRCELVAAIVQHDPINTMESVDRLLLSAGRLASRHQLHISEMLYTVIEHDSQWATRIRYQLLERELLPELIIRITVTFCNDEIVFLNGVFRDSPTWFMVQSANSISHFMKVKGRIFGEVERSVAEDDKVQLAMAIRALAGLVGYLGIKLNDAEIEKCLALLRTSKTERIVKLLLSVMLLSSEHAIRSQVSRANDGHRQLVLADIEIACTGRRALPTAANRRFGNADAIDGVFPNRSIRPDRSNGAICARYECGDT
ncbi:hypothetical protein BJV82DRAFT_87774 [Fennellomyces sp. T-0311]|nr:hypothetical protein BJV82DRAFT_87774 [Fennellomyces sp. T-0311]